MSVFSIDMTKSKGIIQEQQAITEKLASIEQSISSVKNRFKLGNATPAIKKKISSTASEVNEECGKAKQLKQCLESAVASYIATENVLLGINPGPNHFAEYVEIFWKIVGKAGVVGSVFSTFGKIITKHEKPSDWTTFAKDLWKTGFKVADTVKKVGKSNTSVDWWSLVGLDKGSLGKIANSNYGAAKRAYHGAASVWKHELREFKNPVGRAKQIGGIVLSFATNAFKNYDEYKTKFENGEVTMEYAVGRGVTEAICETAVDWGKDIAIGSAVAAVFAASGIAAPVVVVGAATVALSAGADWLCEQFTGKGVTEAVSDLVIDTVSSVGQKVTQGVSAAWSGLKKGWSNITSGKHRPSMAW